MILQKWIKNDGYHARFKDMMGQSYYAKLRALFHQFVLHFEVAGSNG